MPVDRLLSVLAARYPTVRTGLDVGFADAAFSSSLRAARGGLWMTAVGSGNEPAVAAGLPAGTVHGLGPRGELPYDGDQFEAVVLNGEVLSVELVREIHRVLRPHGCLFFSVFEETKKQNGHTLEELYRLFLRFGFDVVSVSRTPWWHFGSPRVLTVCARRKAWKEHQGLRRDSPAPFEFRNR